MTFIPVASPSGYGVKYSTGARKDKLISCYIFNEPLTWRQEHSVLPISMENQKGEGMMECTRDFYLYIVIMW